MKIGTTGFRYRAAFNCYRDAQAWSVIPARAFPLLIITPRAAWIDDHAVRREIERLQKPNWPATIGLSPDAAFERAKKTALHQLEMWQANLAQILGRHLANRNVARMDGALVKRAHALRANMLVAAE